MNTSLVLVQTLSSILRAFVDADEGPSSNKSLLCDDPDSLSMAEFIFFTAMTAPTAPILRIAGPHATTWVAIQ